jgi:ankyrin repeat protein
MADVASHPVAARPRFQFSVRMLLIVTALIAVAVAISLSYYRQDAAGRRAILLVQAMRSGNVKEVDQLLKADPRLAHGLEHGTAQSSHTALQNALVRMHPANGSKVIDRILQEKPDVNERSVGGETALQVAAAMNKPAEVQRLIQLGADLNAIDDRGQTPLHMALRSDSTGKVLKLLLDAGADPNINPPLRPPPDWRRPLHTAAEEGNRLIVSHLLDAGAQIDAQDTRGRTALDLALADDHRRHDVATLLIERGANMTAKDAAGLIPGERQDGSNSGMAALVWWEHILGRFDKQDFATLDRLLIAAPQVLSFRFVYEPKTMIDRAMASRRLDLLDYLLSRLHHRFRRDLEALPPLHDVCWFNTPAQKAKELLDGGADVNGRDPFGQTPLHAAAREHNREVLQLLLASGADVRALDTAGTTVLDSAFERSFVPEEGPQTLELLRRAGHPPTVLYAAATGDLDLLQELTRGKRELLDRVYTRTGVRPLHAAILGNQPRVVEWLLAQGIERESSKRPDWRANWSQSPLLLALSYNLVDVSILLIRNGADVNRPSDEGYPVHVVIRWDRDPRILETLLAHGADPLLKYQDKTAVELARQPEPKHLKLKNRDRYLEILDAATNTAAGH